MYLLICDVLFTILHLAIVIFLMTGWVWKQTRKIHFLLVSATVFCWVILGFWYGFGYCPITDWQWSIKAQRGETDLPNSFIKYIADYLTGRYISSSIIDGVTAGSFGFVVVITVYLAAKRKWS